MKHAAEFEQAHKDAAPNAFTQLALRSARIAAALAVFSCPVAFAQDEILLLEEDDDAPALIEEEAEDAYDEDAYDAPAPQISNIARVRDTAAQDYQAVPDAPEAPAAQPGAPNAMPQARPAGQPGAPGQPGQLSAQQPQERTAASPNKQIAQNVAGTQLKPFFAPPARDSAIDGEDLPLARVLYGSYSPADRSRRLRAYWDLSGRYAYYNLCAKNHEYIRSCCNKILTKYNNQLPPAVNTLANSVLKNAQQLRETARLDLLQGQYDYDAAFSTPAGRRAALDRALSSNIKMTKTFGGQTVVLYVPSTMPATDYYETRYDELVAARRAPSAEAARLNALLPLLYETTQSRASQAANEKAIFEAAYSAQTPAETELFAASDRYFRAQKEAIYAVVRYNTAIALYSCETVPGSVNGEALLRTLNQRVGAPNEQQQQQQQRPQQPATAATYRSTYATLPGYPADALAYDAATAYAPYYGYNALVLPGYRDMNAPAPTPTAQYYAPAAAGYARILPGYALNDELAVNAVNTNTTAVPAPLETLSQLDAEALNTVETSLAQLDLPAESLQDLLDAPSLAQAEELLKAQDLPVSPLTQVSYTAVKEDESAKLAEEAAKKAAEEEAKRKADEEAAKKAAEEEAKRKADEEAAKKAAEEEAKRKADEEAAKKAAEEEAAKKAAEEEAAKKAAEEEAAKKAAEEEAAKKAAEEAAKKAEEETAKPAEDDTPGTMAQVAPKPALVEVGFGRSVDAAMPSDDFAPFIITGYEQPNSPPQWALPATRVAPPVVTPTNDGASWKAFEAELANFFADMLAEPTASDDNATAPIVRAQAPQVESNVPSYETAQRQAAESEKKAADVDYKRAQTVAELYFAKQELKSNTDTGISERYYALSDVFARASAAPVMRYELAKTYWELQGAIASQRVEELVYKQYLAAYSTTKDQYVMSQAYGAQARCTDAQGKTRDLQLRLLRLMNVSPGYGYPVPTTIPFCGEKFNFGAPASFNDHMTRAAGLIRERLALAQNLSANLAEPQKTLALNTQNAQDLQTASVALEKQRELVLAYLRQMIELNVAIAEYTAFFPANVSNDVFVKALSGRESK